MVFLVRETHGDWLQVLLPVRPNGSSGWVKATEVRLTQHGFRILIELGAHRITVSEGATVIDEEPIGVLRHRQAAGNAAQFLIAKLHRLLIVEKSIGEREAMNRFIAGAAAEDGFAIVGEGKPIERLVE